MTRGRAPLATLRRLKWRGWWRRLRRRLRTPSGAIFALLGLLMTCLWLGSLLWQTQYFGQAEITPGDAAASPAEATRPSRPSGLIQVRGPAGTSATGGAILDQSRRA